MTIFSEEEPSWPALVARSAERSSISSTIRGSTSDTSRTLPASSATGCSSSRTGVIEDFGPFADVSPRHPDVPVTHLQNRLILPGFIDGHIHFPQVRVLGAYGNQLLDWLQTWIFPEEAEVQRSRLRAHRRPVLLRRPAGRRHDDLPGVHDQQPGLDRGVLRRGGSAQHARDRGPDRHRPFRSRRLPDHAG